jgi:3-deoxy-7-phosphoheptulonate synthase
MHDHARQTENDMKETNDLRIASSLPLISPLLLKREFPITEESVRTVIEARETIHRILEREDRRLLAVVGPCSIHDTGSALEYASRLASLRKRVEDRIYIVLRVYFEKPRTTWVARPHHGSGPGRFLRHRAGATDSPQALIDITSMGYPSDPRCSTPSAQYISDLISWAAIGARTTESQIHREMASGLSMPVGFKNGTSGNLTLAVDALKSTSIRTASSV